MKTWLECKLLGQIGKYGYRRPELYSALTYSCPLTNTNKKEHRISGNKQNMTTMVRNVNHLDINIIKERAAQDYTTSLIVGSAPLPISMFS